MAEQYRRYCFAVGPEKVFARDGDAISTQIGGDLRNNHLISVEFVDLSESVQADRDSRQQHTEHDEWMSHVASTPDKFSVFEQTNPAKVRSAAYRI
jgi:hypothetical protein